MGDKAWEGFNDITASAVKYELGSLLGSSADKPDYSTDGRRLNPLGMVNIEGQSLVAATLLIALVDGFNPCSLWVLTILLAMIVNTQSRARIAAVGGTFLLVTAGVYGLFIAGVFTAIDILRHLTWIRICMGVLALMFAVINIKDYFAFGVGPSLAIPQSLKPTIYRGGREVRKERALPLTLAVTVVFAVAASVIELPCTAGFPALWSSLITEAGVTSTAFPALLSLYVLIYLLVEIVIVLVALVTLRVNRFQETHGRYLKLVAGMVMGALAAVLIVNPSLMEHMASSIYIVGGSLVLTGLVIVTERLFVV